MRFRALTPDLVLPDISHPLMGLPAPRSIFLSVVPPVQEAQDILLCGTMCAAALSQERGGDLAGAW